MEITGLGTAHIDNIRSSSLGTVHSPEKFSEILNRVYEEQNYELHEANNGNNSIDRTDKLYELCLELETFIIKNMLSGMRSTVQKSGFVDDSFAGKMYEDLLWDEYAKTFAKNAEFGLAEQAYRQLKRYY